MAFDSEVESSYELSSGSVDEVTGTIKSASYTYRNEIGDGEIALLELMVEPDEESLSEIPEEFLDDGLWSVIFGAGKGFEPVDGGKAVAHESGKKKRFNNQSAVGLLLASALELDGVADVLKGRGLASEAAIWVGLKFTFKNKELSFTPKGEDEVKYSRQIVTEFHGVEDDAPKTAKKAPAKKASGAAAAKAKAAAAKAAAEAEDGDVLHPGVDGEIREALTALAQDDVTGADHDAFMEAAFADVELDDAAEEAVADEAFFIQLKG